MSRHASKTTIIALTTAALLAVASLTARADNSAAERAAVLAATVSMTQAIEAAEAKTGGTAVGADVELGKSKVYEIDVVLPDGSEKEVMVDMETGQVVSVKND